MAIPSTTIWEVRTTGSDSNGGGFDPVTGSGHTDYSQQDSAQLSLTDVATTGTTTVTSATGGFTSAMIGNGFNIAGTVYFITAVGSSTSITVDRATGTGSSQVGKVGGALANPGTVGGFGAGTSIYIKSGTYTYTTTSSNVAGGYLNLGINVYGYQTTRGDNPLPGSGAPKLSLASGVSPPNFIANAKNVYNIWFDCTSSAGTFANVGGCAQVRQCKITGQTYRGFINNVICVDCVADGGIDWAFYGTCQGCVASNGSSGFISGFVVDCLATSMSNLGFGGCQAVNCTAFSCATAGSGGWYSHCVAWGTGTTAFSSPTGLVNCYGGGYTNDYSSGLAAGIVQNYTHLTSTPYTSGSTGDFSLSTYGQTAIKSLGSPVKFWGISLNNYKDAGAFQHQDASTGGGSGSGSGYSMIM